VTQQTSTLIADSVISTALWQEENQMMFGHFLGHSGLIALSHMAIGEV